MNFQDGFSKNPKTFRDDLFIADGHRGRWKSVIYVAVTFRNFATKLHNRQRYTGCLRNFWPSCRQNNWYHLINFRVKTGTHAVHWLIQTIWIRDSRVHISRWRSAILNSFMELPGRMSTYFTIPSFLTLPVYYKIQNAQWSDQYAVHKINPDIRLMYELHLTVKLYTTACSLSDAAISSKSEELMFVQFA
jgi:hypothetical protein